MKTKRITAYVLLAGLWMAIADLTLAQAQGGAGDYTAALPSVEKIKTQLKGTDPIDTAARQVAVLSYLPTYISRIVNARHYGGPYTPAEEKLYREYSLAAQQMSQDFTKTHTPADAKTFQQLEGKYEIMNGLSWIKQLEGQQAADTYRGAERSLAQSYQQHEEKLQQQMKEDQSGGRSSIAGDPVLDPTGMFARADANRVNDPELRRCLELGESLEACEGVGAVAGMTSILVPWAEKPDPNAPPPVAGVVLVGGYQGRSGAVNIDFGTNLSRAPVAILRNCGTLVSNIFDGREYLLRKSGNTVQLVIANEPQPIVVTLQADGTLTGPGSVFVKGRIITGYTTETKTMMVNGAPAGPQGYDCNGPCSTSSSTPNYGPKIERCTIGPMNFAPPKPVETPKTGIGFLDAISKVEPAVTGFRMTGRYLGDSGLTLEFENGAVIMDCGKAHAKAAYKVENTAGGFVIRVQNGGGAFVLGVGSDSRLSGSGSTTVSGKLVTAIRGDNVSFMPHSESCRVGMFAARSERNTMRASGNAVAAE